MTMIASQTRARERSAATPTRTPWAIGGLASAWRDRAGRFSGLRLAVFGLVLAPALWLGAALALGAAGARPIETALDVTGLWTVRFLLLSLAVTPLRRMFGWSRILRVRRMLGVAAAVYAGLHFGLYLAHQNFDLLRSATEIALRIYLTIGFLALLGLAALAATSTDRWIKSLGPRWNRLHQLSYPIAALALLHFLMQSKFDVRHAVFYVGVFAVLMAYRVLARRGVSLTPGVLALTALASAPLTMGVELGWHAAATSASVEYLLRSNFEFGGQVAPAWRVAAAAMALAGAAAAVRAYKRFKERKGSTAP